MKSKDKYRQMQTNEDKDWGEKCGNYERDIITHWPSKMPEKGEKRQRLSLTRKGSFYFPLRLKCADGRQHLIIPPISFIYRRLVMIGETDARTPSLDKGGYNGSKKIVSHKGQDKKRKKETDR